MQIKLNYILLITFLIASLLTIYVYYLAENQVGEIGFDSEVDNIDFQVCDEDRIFQYYNIGTSYQGGRSAIRKEMRQILRLNRINFKDKSGWITYRFIVNCNGKSGRYRVKEVDKDLNATVFNSEAKKELLRAIKALQKWLPGNHNGQVWDSYYQINFKIEDGKIKEVF